MIMPFAIRKIAIYKEIVCVEGGKPLAKPITLIGVAAVIKNPWYGRGFVEDLSPEQRDGCSELGTVMVQHMMDEAKSAGPIEAYGKSAVVGAAGEVEHASAVIHNLRFGNHYRHALAAESFFSFTNKRGMMAPRVHILLRWNSPFQTPRTLTKSSSFWAHRPADGRMRVSETAIGMWTKWHAKPPPETSRRTLSLDRDLPACGLPFTQKGRHGLRRAVDQSANRQCRGVSISYFQCLENLSH
jgi:hypothetical protein